MLEKLSHTIKTYCHLDPALPILVGVSGGPDSLFLLAALADLGYLVVVAHLDHQLRPESGAEAQSVRDVALRFNFPFVIESQDTGAFAQQQHLSIETAARQLRYKFLFKQAHAHQAQAVAVGHTADDQVETILLHFLRGAGPAGLSGMSYRLLPNAWSSSIPLIRPLLDTQRSQILSYLAERSITPHWDQSNLDLRFFRNRLRHEVIPYLEQYNPQIRQNLLRMAEILRQDELVLHEAADEIWQSSLCSQGEGYIALERRKLLAQPTAIRRRLVRRALAHLLPGLPDIEFEHVEKVLNFMQQPPRSAGSDLVAGIRLFLEQDCLWLACSEAIIPRNHWPQLDQSTPVALDIPGNTRLAGNWRLQAAQLPMDTLLAEQARANQNAFQAWLDYEQLQFPLILRHPQPGDRIQPLGMSGRTIKLSDLFTNRKLPKRARHGWPILCSGEQIAWVPGYQIGHAFRLTDETRKVIHLVLRQK